MSVNLQVDGRTYQDAHQINVGGKEIGITEVGTIPTPTGSKSITANGTGIDVLNYAAVDVNVPSGGITPTGTISITQNGTVDVTDYASANVNVPSVSPTGTKQISITSNGTVTEDVTNYANAEINVNVSGGGGVGSLTKYETHTITAENKLELVIPHNLGVVPKYVSASISTPSGSMNVIDYIVSNQQTAGCLDGNDTALAYKVELNSTGTTNSRVYLTSTSVVVRSFSSAKGFSTESSYTVELYA